MTNRDIVDINVLDTDRLLDFDDMTIGDVDLFNVMDQLTDNGHEDIVNCFKKQVLECYQIAVFELKQLHFNDPIVANLRV